MKVATSLLHSAIAASKVPSALLAETKTYRDRVQADGGTVTDITLVDSLLRTAKDQGFYADLAFIGGAELGYQLTSGAISTLYDASGNASDSVQGTAASRPTTGAHVGLNDKQAVIFDGSDHLPVDAIASALQGDFTIISLTLPSKAGNIHPWGAQGSTSGHYIDLATDVRSHTTTYRLRSADADETLQPTTGRVSAKEPALTSVVKNGTTSTIYKDGVSQGTGTVANSLSGLDQALLGGHNGYSATFQGSYALHLCVSAALTDAQRTALEQAIQNHFAFQSWTSLTSGGTIIPSAPSGFTHREPSNVLHDPDDVSDFQYKVFLSHANDSTGEVEIHMYHGADLDSLSAYSGNPIIGTYAEDAYAIIDPGTGDYRLFCEDNATNDTVGRYSSSDKGRTWVADGSVGLIDAASPVVWIEPPTWHMLYEQYPTSPNDIRHATSSDGMSFTPNPNNPVFSAHDASWITSEDVVPDEVIKEAGIYYIFMHAAGGFYNSGMIITDDIANPDAYASYEHDVAYNAVMPWRKTDSTFEAIALQGAAGSGDATEKATLS